MDIIRWYIDGIYSYWIYVVYDIDYIDMQVDDIEDINSIADGKWRYSYLRRWKRDIKIRWNILLLLLNLYDPRDIQLQSLFTWMLMNK